MITTILNITEGFNSMITVELTQLISGGIIAVLGFLLARYVRQVDGKQKEVEKRVTDIEKNYKEEFKTVRSDANENHVELLSVIGELQVGMTKALQQIEAQAKLCQLVQSQKNNNK